MAKSAARDHVREGCERAKAVARAQMREYCTRLGATGSDRVGENRKKLFRKNVKS